MAAGDITDAIVARIRANVRDETAPYAYSDNQMYDKLNDTQLEMGLLLPVELLGEFITPAASPGTISGGSASITVSVLGSYERAIIRAYDVTDSKWMTKMTDLTEMNSSLFAPTTSSPVFAIRGSLIYVWPTTIASAQVDYLKTPTAISGSVDPTLNSALHYLLQKGAEWRVRGTLNDKDNLTAQIKSDYYSEIEALNKKGMSL